MMTEQKIYGQSLLDYLISGYLNTQQQLEVSYNLRIADLKETILKYENKFDGLNEQINVLKLKIKQEYRERSQLQLALDEIKRDQGLLQQDSQQMKQVSLCSSANFDEPIRVQQIASQILEDGNQRTPPLETVFQNQTSWQIQQLEDKVKQLQSEIRQVAQAEANSNAESVMSVRKEPSSMSVRVKEPGTLNQLIDSFKTQFKKPAVTPSIDPQIPKPGRYQQTPKIQQPSAVFKKPMQINKAVSEYQGYKHYDVDELSTRSTDRGFDSQELVLIREEMNQKFALIQREIATNYRALGTQLAVIQQNYQQLAEVQARRK